MKAPRRIDPAAMTVEEAADLLSSAGSDRITADMVRADLAAGAPTRTDGRINLVAYAAWLVKEASRA